MKTLVLLVFRILRFAVLVIAFMALFQAGPDGFWNQFLQEFRDIVQVFG